MMSPPLSSFLSVGRFLALLGTVLIALSDDPLEALQSAVDTFVGTTLPTVVTVGLVMIIESQMRLLGVVDLIGRLAGKIGVRLSLFAVPTLLGLIPTTAGAKLSAGIVAALGKEQKVSGRRLAAINFWFRHVSIFCNPLIPGVILAAAIADMSPGEVVRWGVPMAVICSGFGAVFFLRGLRPLAKDGEGGSDAAETETTDIVLRSGDSAAERRGNVPFVLMLAAVVAAALITLIPLPLLLSLPAGLGLFFLRDNVSLLKGAVKWRLMLELVCILWFAAAVRSTGLLDSLAVYLENNFTNPLLAVVVASFIVSFVTGACLPATSIVMPVAVSTFPGNDFVVYLTLAAGFAAQFVTPTHLCLVVSAEAFRTSAFRLAASMLIPLGLSFFLWWELIYASPLP